MIQEDECSLEKAVEEQLLRLYGPMLSGDALRSALGYPTMEAFRQALSRKKVPIPVFAIEARRGKFALVKDLAHWLVAQRNAHKGADVR